MKSANGWIVVRRVIPAVVSVVAALLATRAAAQPMQTLRGHVPGAIANLKPVGAVPADTPIDLVIGLPLRNEEKLNALLRDLYDPSSPTFRQYMTPERFTETFGPSAATFDGLVAFAKANRLTIVDAPANRKFVHVRAPASEVNRVFHVTLQQYQHPTEKRLFYAPDAEPSIDFEPRLLHVTGLDSFRLPGRLPNRFGENAPGGATPRSAGGSGSEGLYTGGDFRAAYAPDVTLKGAGQAVGILVLNGYKTSDIEFYENSHNMAKVPLQNVYLSGFTGSTPEFEATADIELVISMAPGIDKVVVYGASDAAGVPALLNEMANPTKGEPLPYQITTSYYFYYDKNIYDGLKQLAAQGQAFSVASGDFGSYDETTGSGDFPPADHPLMTSVGGTLLQTAGPGGAWASETAWQWSGGGHSPWGPGDAQFALPAWQSGISNAQNLASTVSRNSPDVAMVADEISLYFNGSWAGFAGTSASSPLWTGFLALANEQAAKTGKPRIGFANPAIYAAGTGSAYASAFHDITTGNNFNATNPNKYQAVTGFDLCTGWGSPRGMGLIDALVDFRKGWAKVPGGGTTQLPDAATTYKDRVYLFGIGINDQRHYVNSFDGSAWSGWSAVPGNGTTALGDAAAVYRYRIYLFGIGINDRRHYVNSFDGSAWSGWSALPGGGTTALADAAVAFQDRLYLFGIGINDHKHYVNSFDGNSWSGWSEVPGGGTTTLSDAAVVFNNRLYLFAVGTNDHKHYVNTFDGHAWGGWGQVPGGGTTQLADAAAVLNGRLYLFGIGINDRKHYVDSFDGSAWSGWSQVTGGGTTALPDAATTFRDKIYLFAIGTNDHQHYMNVFP